MQNNLYDSVVITGAGGMLGHALAGALKARGNSPILLTRAECDIANDDHLPRIFDHKPTLVLNCAAHTKVDQCDAEPAIADAINGYAVGKMAAQCRRSGAFLVHISTDFVFDGSSHRPFRVDDPVHPLQAYGRSKLLGETELKKHGSSDWLIIRTAWVYGRYGVNFPRTMVTAARAGKPLKVVSDQVGSPTYTVDLAEAILALLDAGHRGIWHVTNSGQTNWFEFAKATLEEFDLKPDVTPLSSADWQKMKPSAVARPGYSALDIEPFARAVGRPMRPWRQALKDFRAEVERAGEF